MPANGMKGACSDAHQRERDPSPHSGDACAGAYPHAPTTYSSGSSASHTQLALPLLHQIDMNMLLLGILAQAVVSRVP